MPPRPLALAAGLAAAIVAAPAFAQTPAAPPQCAATSDAGLPRALAAWSSRTPLAAGPTDVEAANLPIGAAVDAQLRHTRAVSYPVAPTKPGDPMSHGGIYAMRISTAGDYQVSLGAGAWVEVITNEMALVPATRHGRGPACSSLKTTVVFPLQRGRYYLAITGAEGPVLPLLVTRAGP